MKTVLTLLQELYPESSNSHLRSLVKHGRVLVDGRLAKRDESLPDDTKLEIIQKKLLGKSVVVLYQDSHIIVVEKPEGLLTVETDKEKFNTLHCQLKKQCGRVWPVHRLDRETSGVMVFALSEVGKDGLKDQFIDHSIHREYVAVVEGILEGTGTWQSHLLEDKNFFVRPHPDGELAITHFEALRTNKHTTLVRFTLETGKKNQIRVQAASKGHPVVGDKKYGNGVKGRLKLHAHKLEFLHPVTQKKLSFNLPVPFN
jgi:23S rRNA pseudouridine1911/1915/1917 synthase